MKRISSDRALVACGLLLACGLAGCSDGAESTDHPIEGAGSAAPPGPGQAGMSAPVAGAMGPSMSGAPGAGTGNVQTGGSGAGSGAGAGGSAAGSSGGSAAGSGGGAGDGGGSGGAEAGQGGAAGSGMAMKPRPPCTTKPSQVVILGDSYINWVSHTFPQDMADAAGETWRMYAVGGFAMGSGGIGLIPPTFDDALAEDPDIKAAVMDGGGNDILVPDPKWDGGADCKNREDAATVKVCQDIVQTAMDAAQQLMMHAADKGVKDVVYFFYPHVPEPTLVGGDHPNAMLDYSLPKVTKLCEDAETMTSGRLRCHFVDTVPLFEGKPELFAPTDIHENSDGSKVIAGAIWKTMKEACIAQPASSGCCEP